MVLISEDFFCWSFAHVSSKCGRCGMCFSCVALRIISGTSHVQFIVFIEWPMVAFTWPWINDAHVNSSKLNWRTYFAKYDRLYIVQFSGNSVAKSRIQWKREREGENTSLNCCGQTARERDLWREKNQGTCFNCLFTFLLLWLNVRFGIEKPVSYAMYKMVQCHNPSEIFVIMCEIDETAVVVLRSRGFEVNAWMDFTVTQVRPLRENIRLRGKTFERGREKPASVHVFSIKQ